MNKQEEIFDDVKLSTKEKACEDTAEELSNGKGKDD